ncbi:MAG: sulfotransferase [candidate division KSB1 bacterium]|nr:sulfotransferase [candidate division KSB1 bacterium]MDZ7301318.1 sulfotransferase [candidate division KSB1 bacterium]MDZ7310797.1 sulfotransferase [candidate division KSB1 bacterium]
MVETYFRKVQNHLACRKVDLQAAYYLFRNTSFRKAQRILQLGRRPIVIGGCGRSGTTLLLSVLSCHPKIFAIDIETVALCPDGYGADGMYNQAPNLDVPFRLERIYQYFIEREIPAGNTRWCEKTPRNVLYFGRILQHFGTRVRLLHMVRDGRDVVTSIHPRAPTRFWVTPHRWVQDVAAGREFENHPQVLTIFYEDLVREYEATMRRICEFIDEEFVEAFLSYPDSARLKETGAWFHPAQATTDKSIGRWKDPKYREVIESFWREPMAGELMQHYGYDKV